MLLNSRKGWGIAAICLMLVLSPAGADDPLSAANAAVSNILFEYDADDFATFAINDRGFVDISFAQNTPDPLYSEILGKLRSHPDIKGVLPGKGGPVCARF